jgi:hypothetical protein
MKKIVFLITITCSLSISIAWAQFDFDGNQKFASDCEEHNNENFFSVSAYDVFGDRLIPGASVYKVYSCDSSRPGFYSAAKLEYIIDTLAANYGGAEIVGYDGKAYNCHSYAWHVSEGGDMIILNEDVDAYETFYGFNNDKIYKVTEGSKTFPNALKVTYPDDMNHSAITTLENEVFISKWGAGFLIKHDWDEHVYGNCNYNELEFWGPTSFYPEIKEMYDMSYYLGTYILGEDIHLEKVRIDLSEQGNYNTDWFTVEFTNGVEINGPFEVTKGSALTIQPAN